MIYFFGLSFIYMIFGILAGFSGGAFNTILRQPEINLAIAIVIFLLGLSSMEFLHIPIFKPKNIGADSKSVSGTFLLGMGAGLLSSPCVGPIVVTILLHLTVSQNEISILSLSITSFKMLFFGMGVGLPFFAIGILGFKLPKSGSWMKWIQYILAAFIFYFAYTYFEKSMDTLGFTKPESNRILLAFVIFLISVYLFQSEEELRYIKMKKAVTLTGILFAIVILYKISNSLSEGKTKSANPAIESSIEEHGNLKWYRAHKMVFEKAREENKKIFIDFYADWCSNCKKFQSLTLSDKELNHALSETILYKIYDTDPEFEEYAKQKEYSELKIGLPFFVILDKEGKLIFKTTDYLRTRDMIRFLKE
ncbi:MAG: thioredoxin family protein [Leptospiraceae bacterium]|nr:thioredoxin family protein [Leptospiraceae bacterium]